MGMQMKNEFRAFRIASFSVATNWSVVWDAKGGSLYAVHYDFFLPAVSACGVSSKMRIGLNHPRDVLALVV